MGLRKYNQITVSAGGYSENSLKAASKVDFQNIEESGLGIPFPKGTFRVFKEDKADGSLEFIGEDSINHTPKDEKITLSIGNAFDITANLYSESRTNNDRQGGYTANMNLTIINHKSTSSEIEVKINSYYGGNLKLTWGKANGVQLTKESTNLYKIVSKVEPDQTVVYKWTEEYQP